jgi:hypothetical protein
MLPYILIFIWHGRQCEKVFSNEIIEGGVNNVTGTDYSLN